MRTPAHRLLARLAFPTAAIVALAGCELVDSARTVVVPAETEVTVPGRPVVGGNPLVPADVIPSDLGAVLSQQVTQQIATEGVPRDAVDSMKVTRFSLVVEDPVQGGQQVRDLGFLERVAFSLGAADLEPVLVAASPAGAFDDDPVELDLELTEAELVDVLKASDQLDMEADFEVDPRGPAFDTTVLFQTEVTILVNPVGAASAAQGQP